LSKLKVIVSDRRSSLFFHSGQLATTIKEKMFDNFEPRLPELL